MNRRLWPTLGAVGGGAAALPLLLLSLVRRHLPGGSGPHPVASVVRTHPEQFLCRVFYPTNGTAGAAGFWLPRPVLTYAKGIGAFLRLPEAARWFLPVLGAVRGGWLEASAGDPPLPLPPAGATSSLGKPDRLPLVVFSHGIGGSQTMYSGWCVELASRGYVVVAVEHSDASASATLVAPGRQDGPLFYQFPDKQLIGGDRGYSWRHGQQELRVEQLLGAAEHMLHEAATDSSSPLHGRLDSGNVFVAGHSFGGATAVAASARAASTHVGVNGFRAAVILDGWLWPLCGDDMDTRAIDRDFGAADRVPLLFLDAESFVEEPMWWAPKAELARRCSRAGRVSALLSLRQAVHFSFSDVLVLGGRAFSLLSLLRKAPSRQAAGSSAEVAGVAPSPEFLLAEAARVSAAFFGAHLANTPASAWSGTLSPQAWRVLEADPSLGLLSEAPAPRAKL